MSEKLYQMTGRLLALAQLLDDPDVPDEAIRDTIEGIEGEIEVKAEGLLKFVANLDGDLSSIDSEIRRLQARKKVLSNRKEGLREYLRMNMEVTGISRIECSLFLISLAAGRDVVLINQEDELPEKFIVKTTTTRPDKKRILEALMAGEEVPGASLGKSKTSLRIK